MANARPSIFILYWLLICVNLVNLVPAKDDCDRYFRHGKVYRTESYCFALAFPSELTWPEAANDCVDNGGVLAKMDEHILTDATAGAIANGFQIPKGIAHWMHVGFSKTPGNTPTWLLDGSKVTTPVDDWLVADEGTGMLLMDNTGDSLTYSWFLYPGFIGRSLHICQFDLQPLKIRLVNGSKPSEGRVEIFFNKAWGTVCDSYWDNHDAEVVCRMLGFPTHGAVARNGGFFGKGSGQILLKNVQCRGNETSLMECWHIWGRMICYVQADAGVECPGPSVGTMPDFIVGTTPAGPVEEITDVTVYGTTALSAYVNADSPLITTASVDGTTEDNLDGTKMVSIYVIPDTPFMPTTTISADERTEDNADRTTEVNRAQTTISFGSKKLASPSGIRRKRKPAQISKVVAMTGESVYIDGQALFERRSAMVTMCSRLCSSDNRCARFNYNQVTGECRIFSKDAEVSYKTEPDWTVWEAIVIQK